MSVIHSFEPWIGIEPRVLILGSMPGVKSLQAQCYYAHPRNAFWPILETLFGMDEPADCAERRRHFETLPLALWDVLESCRRPGSLDSAIVADSVRPNAIPRLLERHPSIGWLLFNGATAERLFRRHLLAEMPPSRRLSLRRLPSTSPAYAGMSLGEKQRHWSAAFAEAGINPEGCLSISKS